MMNVCTHTRLYCALLSLLFSTYLLANPSTVAQSQPNPPAIQQTSPSISLYPQRFFLSDTQPTAAITLMNAGNGIGSYEIDVIDFLVNDDGEYTAPKTTLPTSAKPFLRYSPKKGRLRPNQSRRILITKRAPRRISPGEYRSHLRIISSPIQPPSATLDPLAPKKQASLSAQIRQGISIPVIVRVGKVNASGTFTSSKLRRDEQGQFWLHLTLLRNGTRSLYGRIEVFEGDKRVGIANKVSLYTPNTQRNVKILLDDQTYTSTKPLNIRYISEDPLDTGALIAATTLSR